MREQRPFYRSARIITWLGAGVFLLFYVYLTWRAGQLPSQRDVLRSIFYTLTLRLERIPGNMVLLALDGMLCFFGTFLWMVFYAQFVLPIRTLKDRYLAAERLVIYATGEHGPAIFIKDGSPRERRGELRARGPGVVILDTASGAVLRDDFAFTRPAGPGVVFTRKNEYLAKSVDLHLKRSELGPRGEEDPFQPRLLEEVPGEESEAVEFYQQRQERRLETSGLTRDGVEVVPNVLVVYRLKRKPGDKSFSFGYNPISVQQWVTADGPYATSPSNSKWDDIPLEQLPAFMAVEVWREGLQKFTLNDLFTSPVGTQEGAQTAYALLARTVSDRLTQHHVDTLDENGNPTGGKMRSPEFIALNERGIEVLSVSIFHLRFESQVESRIVQQWVATWLQRARAERIQVERKRAEAIMAGRREALVGFVRSSSRDFDAEILSLPWPEDENDLHRQIRLSLQRLVQGMLVESTKNPRYVQLMQMEETNLRDLLAWIGEQEL